MTNQCTVKKQAMVEFLSGVGNNPTQLALFKGYLDDINQAFGPDDKLKARMSLQQFVLSQQMSNDLYKADIISNIERYGIATNSEDITNTLKSLNDSKRVDDEVLVNVMGISKKEFAANKKKIEKGFENKLLYDYLYNLNFGTDTTLRRVNSAEYKESGFTDMTRKEQNKYIKDQSSKLAEKYTTDKGVDRQGILNRLKVSYLHTETTNDNLLVDYVRLKNILNISLNVEDYLDELNKLQSNLDLIKPDFSKDFINSTELESELVKGLSYILSNKNEQAGLLSEYASKLFSLKTKISESKVDTMLKTLDYISIKYNDITAITEQIVKSNRDIVVFKKYGYNFNNLDATNNVNKVEKGLYQYINTKKPVNVVLGGGEVFTITNKNYKKAFDIVGMNTFSDEQLADIYMKLNSKGTKKVAESAEKQIIKEVTLEEVTADVIKAISDETDKYNLVVENTNKLFDDKIKSLQDKGKDISKLEDSRTNTLNRLKISFDKKIDTLNKRGEDKTSKFLDKQAKQQAKIEEKEQKIAKTLAEKAEEIELKKQEFINSLRIVEEDSTAVNNIIKDQFTSFTFKKDDKILFVDLPTNKYITKEIFGQNNISLGKSAIASKSNSIKGAISEYKALQSKGKRVVIVVNGPDNRALFIAEGKEQGLNPSELNIATNNINPGQTAFDVIDGKLSMISPDKKIIEDKKVALSEVSGTYTTNIKNEDEAIELGDFFNEVYGGPKDNSFINGASQYAQAGTKDDILYKKRIFYSVIEITEGRAKVEGVNFKSEYDKIQASSLESLVADLRNKEGILGGDVANITDEKKFRDSYFWYENSLNLEQKDAARQSLLGAIGEIPNKLDSANDAKIFEAHQQLSKEYKLPRDIINDVYLGKRTSATDDYVASFLASNQDKLVIGLTKTTGQDAKKTYNIFEVTKKGYNKQAIDEGYRVFDNAFKNSQPKKYEDGLDVNINDLPSYDLVYKNYDSKTIVNELIINIAPGGTVKKADGIKLAYNKKINEFNSRLKNSQTKEEVMDVYSDIHYYNNRFRKTIKDLYGEETKAEYYLQQLPDTDNVEALKNSITNDIVVMKSKVEDTTNKVNNRIKDIEKQTNDPDWTTNRFNKIYEDGFVVEARGGIITTTTIEQEIKFYLDKFSGIYDDIDEVYALKNTDINKLNKADKQEALDLVVGLHRNITTNNVKDLKVEALKLKYANDAVVTNILNNGYIVKTDSTLGDNVISLPKNLVDSWTPGLALQIDRSVKFEIFTKISDIAKKEGLTDSKLRDTVNEVVSKYKLHEGYNEVFTAMFIPYLSVGNFDMPESILKQMQKKDYTNIDAIIETRRPDQTVTVNGIQTPVKEFSSLTNGKYYLDKGDQGIKTETPIEVLGEEQLSEVLQEKIKIVDQELKTNIQKLDDKAQQADGLLSTNIDAAKGTYLEYWKSVIQESGHGRAKKSFVEGFTKVFDDVKDTNIDETINRLSEFYTTYQKLYDEFGNQLTLSLSAPSYILRGNPHQEAAWALFQYNNGIKNSTANLAKDIDINDLLKNQHNSVLNLKAEFIKNIDATDKLQKFEKHLAHVRGYGLNVESGQIMKQATFGMKSENAFLEQFKDYNRFVEVFGIPKSDFAQKQLYNSWINKPYIGSVFGSTKNNLNIPATIAKGLSEGINFLARSISLIGGAFIMKSQLLQYINFQTSRNLNYGNIGLTASKYGIGDFADLDFLKLYDELSKALGKDILGPGDIEYVLTNQEKFQKLKTIGKKFWEEAYRSPGNIADMLYRPMLQAVAIEDGLKTNGIFHFTDINELDEFMKRADVSDQRKEDIIRAINTRTTRSYEDLTYFPQGVYGSYIGSNDFFALIGGKANYGSWTNNMRAGVKGLADTLFGFKSSRGLYGMDRMARVLRGGWSEFIYANKIGDIDGFMQRIVTEPRYNNLLKEMGSAMMAARIQERLLRDNNEEEPSILDKAKIILDAFEGFTQMGASLQSNYIGRVLTSSITNSYLGISNLPQGDNVQITNLDVIGESIKQALGADLLRPQAAVAKTASEVINMLEGDSSWEGMMNVFSELSARSIKYDMEYSYSNASHIEQTYVSRFNAIFGSTSKEAALQGKVNKLNKLMDVMGANDKTVWESWTQYLPVIKNIDALINPKNYLTRGEKNNVLTLLSETPQYMNYKLGGKLLGATTASGKQYEREVLADMFKQDSQIGYGLKYELEKYINDGVIEKDDIKRILEASGVNDVEGAKALYDSLENSSKSKYAVADVQLLLQGAIGGNLVGASSGLVKTAMIKEYDNLEKKWKKDNKVKSVPNGVKEQLQRSVFNKYQESLVLTNRPEMDSMALSIAMRDNPKLSDKYLVDRLDKDGKPIKYNGVTQKKPAPGIESEVFKMGEEMRAFEEGLNKPEKITSVLAQDISRDRTPEEASILLKMKMDYIDQLPMSYNDKRDYKIRIIQGNIGLASRIDDLSVDDDIKNGVKSQLFNTVRDATSDEMFEDITTQLFGSDSKGGSGGSGGGSGGGGKVSGDLAKAIKDITKAVQGNKSYTESKIDYPKVDYMLQYAPSNKAAKRLGDLQANLGIAKSEPFINIYNKGTTGKTTGAVKPRKIKKYVYKPKKSGAK